MHPRSIEYIQNYRMFEVQRLKSCRYATSRLVTQSKPIDSRSNTVYPLILSLFERWSSLQVSASRYPVVVKLGHAHGGVGKARAETNQEFLDLASLAALANTYCTSEPYVDTKYDVHVQKIGNNYKAFMWVPRNVCQIDPVICRCKCYRVACQWILRFPHCTKMEIRTRSLTLGW